MIEIFKTNITTTSKSEKVKNQILAIYPLLKISFDLEDCDRILRIEGNNFNTEIIINILKELHCVCEILE
jgi:hypothetical protein